MTKQKKELETPEKVLAKAKKMVEEEKKELKRFEFDFDKLDQLDSLDKLKDLVSVLLKAANPNLVESAPDIDKIKYLLKEFK